jgi:L-amino acid N-acyltransferase YncA
VTLRIRRAKPEDAEAIVGVLNPIIEAAAYTVLTAPLTADFERRYIAGFPPRGVFNLAVRPEDGTVFGLQTIEPFATYTRALDHVATVGTYVDLSHRGQGIGKRLSEAGFEAARGRGFEKLLSYVRSDNPAALAFYLGLGFRVVGIAERQARVGSRYVDETIIEKFL